MKTHETETIDTLYDDVCEGDPRHCQALGRLLGLFSRRGAATGPWPTQAEVAAELGVPGRRLSRWTAKARRRWARIPALLAAGAAIRSYLERRGVATVAELAEALRTAAPRCERRSPWLPVVRAAVEAEQVFQAPQFRAFRRLGAVFVAPTAGGGLPALTACAEALRREGQAPGPEDEEARFAAAADEIVDAVLDAADQEILAEVAAGGAPEGRELLCASMLEVVRRYRERECRERKGGTRCES